MESNEFKFSLSLEDCTFHIRSNERRGLPYTETHDEFEEIKTGSPETLGLHRHYYMELQYIYSGEMEVSTNGVKDSTRKVTAGNLCFIPKELYHSTSPTDHPVRFGFTLSLECNKESAANHSNFLHFSKIFNGINDVTIVNDPLINTYMNHSNEIAHSPIYHTNAYQGSIILAVVLRFAEIQHEKYEAITSPKINYTPEDYDRKWIIENFIAKSHSTDCTIDELAKKLYLSTRQTRTVVKKIMGDDFKSLIIKQRIDLANVLMENSELPLEEIAERVGYNSYSSFYTAYVKHMGFSPNKYNSIQKTAK